MIYFYYTAKTGTYSSEVFRFVEIVFKDIFHQICFIDEICISAFLENAKLFSNIIHRYTLHYQTVVRYSFLFQNMINIGIHLTKV